MTTVKELPGADFVWGPVDETVVVGDIGVVRYVSSHNGGVFYHPFLRDGDEWADTHHSFPDLYSAVAWAIAYLRTGDINGQAGRMFDRMTLPWGCES